MALPPLNTPVAVYRVVRNYFPESQARLVEQNGSESLEIILMESGESLGAIHVSEALDGARFEKSLQSYATLMALARATKHLMAPRSFETTSAMIRGVSLVDWISFLREQKGSKSLGIIAMESSKPLGGIHVSEALAGTRFVESLRSYATLMALACATKHPVVPGFFAITSATIRGAPLADWTSFPTHLRAEYEKRRGRDQYVGLLVAYLEGNQAALRRLEQLRLAPGDIATPPSDADMEYFGLFYDRLDRMPREESCSLFAKFRKEYEAPVLALVSRLSKRKAGDSKYNTLLKKLQKRISGQDPAVHLVACTLASQQNSATNRQFLFVGPTGVGKTELAKVAAAVKETRLVRFDMQQFAHEHDIAQLFGAPTGYKGSTDKPRFAKELDCLKPTLVDRNSLEKVYLVHGAVVLFDEMEKAHPVVRQSLLTLFDEGFCKVQYTERGNPQTDQEQNLTLKYRFERSIFIGTTNLFAEQILDAFQQNMLGEEIARQFIEWNRKQHSPANYSSEFLGRLAVVPFGPIPRGDCYQNLLRDKMDLLLEKLRVELGFRSIVVDEVFPLMESLLYGEGIDVRRIDRYVENQIKPFVYRTLAGLEGRDQMTVVLALCETNQLGIKVTKDVYGQILEWLPLTPLSSPG